jgi:hypothetical protein
MKTISFLASFAVIIITSSFVSVVIDKPATKIATTNGCFKQFRIHRQGNAVALSWAVSCNDVAQLKIERSYDGDSFEPVGAVICNAGSIQNYMDSEVYPGTIYYHIKAEKYDGSTELSPMEAVRIVKRF